LERRLQCRGLTRYWKSTLLRDMRIVPAVGFPKKQKAPREQGLCKLNPAGY